MVKILATCERLTDADGREGVSARVYPALCRASHPLASVHGAKNAVFVEAEAAGDLMFYGAGAGGVETASAVLGDLVSAARRHVIGGPGVAESTQSALPVFPIGTVRTATRSRSLPTPPGCSRPSRRPRGTRRQRRDGRAVERPGDGGTATLVIGTHQARESDLADTVVALRGEDVVTEVTSVLRVIGA